MKDNTRQAAALAIDALEEIAQNTIDYDSKQRAELAAQQARNLLNQ